MKVVSGGVETEGSEELLLERDGILPGPLPRLLGRQRLEDLLGVVALAALVDYGEGRHQIGFRRRDEDPGVIRLDRLLDELAAERDAGDFEARLQRGAEETDGVVDRDRR